MIVLTGYGRSGTSVLARIYTELGCDLGGGWNDEVDAGLEHEDVWRLNDEIATRLGIAIPGTYHRTPARRRATRLLRVARILRQEDRLFLLPPIRRPTHVDRSAVQAVASDLGGDMRALATSLDVVKDPRLLWTMGVWLEAGAEISAAVVCVRDIDAVVASRKRANRLRWSSSAIQRSIEHGLRLFVESAAAHGVPFTVVRYPDFLDDPVRLHRQLVLRQDVTDDAVRAAVEAVRR